MDWQTIVVGIIGLAAVGALLRWLWRLLTGRTRGACDGCASGECPGCRDCSEKQA